MDVTLETERMRLRPIEAADLDHLAALDSDPEVMRFVGNGRPRPYEMVRDQMMPRLLAYNERSDRHGFWAAQERSGPERFLGWFHLKLPDSGDLAQAELGYRLRREVWGRGLATEGSQELLRVAFDTFEMRRVFAITMAINTGSRRVMEKAGLRYVRTFHLEFDDPIPGTEHGEVEYAITAEEWLAGS